MKHSGRARKAAFKIILFTLVAVIVLWGLSALAAASAAVITTIAFVIFPFLFVVWLFFAIFTLYFFRDPTPRVPADKNAILSPAHGKVDVMDTITERKFMGGECQRISVFLSVIDIHVQNSPVSGRVGFFEYTEGEFMNAMKSECALHNENALLGFEATEPPGLKMAIRVIAGVLARRIVPYVKAGDVVQKGERIGLVQFGSRADIFLPLNAKIKIKLGDHVVGGETIIATFE
jgi:phosphatidylserine decarboxylase